MATTAFSIDRLRDGASEATLREIEEGLPVSAMRDVMRDKAIKLADLVGIVASRRTLDRRLAGNGPLTLEEGDKLVQFAKVVALATHVMGDRVAAMEWLRAPQFDFNGLPPIEYLRTQTGNELVIQLLQRFRHGMLA
ncbi:antitoxin Xre/MbcA/ParS toxin-binding domain-containing protein [uncultured Sphingomonas sp.]|uniref:antitoxin Xre/MbcA/ParS toxin-binding domain-containing protein n=1 Tax=uncultured Sphingomonas sp. TaxID=158754 RepID=UPI0035CBFBD5